MSNESANRVVAPSNAPNKQVTTIEMVNDIITQSNLYILPGSPLPNKLVLRGDGDHVYAAFEPQLSLQALGAPVYLLPGRGKGSRTHKGSGEFQSGQVLLGPLDGTYTLQVGVQTVRLLKGEHQIWYGTGAQTGLDGQFDIKFSYTQSPP